MCISTSGGRLLSVAKLARVLVLVTAFLWCAGTVRAEPEPEPRTATSGYGRRNSSMTTTPMVTTFRPPTTTGTSVPVTRQSTTVTTSKDTDEPRLDDPNGYQDDAFTPRSDELIYNLMESMITTIHEKLRRSETLENTCRTMLDQMSRRLDYHNDKLDVAVSKLRSIDQTFQQQQQYEQKHGTGGMSVGTLDVRLQALGTKVDGLASKLSDLKEDVVRDKRGTLMHAIVEGDLSAQASEPLDIVRDKSGRMILATDIGVADERVTKDIESVKDTLNNLDARIQDWMQHVSNSIGDLHDAIIEPDDGQVQQQQQQQQPPLPSDMDLSASSSSSSTMSAAATNRTSALPMGGELMFKETKLDKLFRKINPVLRVTEKMDEMWDVVLGTQRLVDDSLQKSDQLLTNSYRQVQSLADVKTYLQRQTGKIMQNLEQVEDWLKEQGASSPSAATVAASSASASPSSPMTPNIDPKMLTQGIKDILNRTMLLNEKVAAGRREKVQAQDRSSEPIVPQSEDSVPAFHRDTEYTQDRRKTQILEAKSEIAALNANATTTPTMSTTTTSAGRSTMLPSFKRKQLAASVAAAAAALLAATNGTSAKTKPGASLIPVETCPFQGPPGVNCADLRRRGVTKSGVYYILIKGTTYWFMKVFCDMETDGGGWTVMHNRDDFRHPRENFIRDWNDYKNGFGDMNREFWLGNENVFMLTNQEDYVLRVDLQDFDGHKRYAIYTKFKIFSEAENYRLEIGNYEGDAGDSLNDPWYGSNLNPFSTYDRDNDRSSLNCASMLRGGWWWRSCGRGLNGIYLLNPTDLAARQGIVWFRWRGWDYTLKKARMAIRPKEFVAPPTPSPPSSSSSSSSPSPPTLPLTRTAATKTKG